MSRQRAFSLVRRLRGFVASGLFATCGVHRHLGFDGPEVLLREADHSMGYDKLKEAHLCNVGDQVLAKSIEIKQRLLVPAKGVKK